MQYIIFAEHQGEEGVMLCGPVAPEDESYLRKTVIPRLQPLSDEQYMEGPALILQTMARYSYILDGEVVYWCCEWKPGLLVIRFSPDRRLQWAAIRSPNPGFGGREATDEELEAWQNSEDEPNHQYNLVFDAWDAQFDEIDREGWPPATEEIRGRYESALAHVNELGEQLQAKYEDDQAAFQAWRGRCEASSIWKGELAMG